MKNSQQLLWILCVFYIAMTAVYSIWTTVDHGITEWAGTVGLALCAIFCAFIAFYLGVENKPFLRKPLPEDRLDAEIADADADLGHFSPQSLWPILLAGAVACVMFGAATGWWFSFFAFPFLLVTLVGWVYEYYRGHFAH